MPFNIHTIGHISSENAKKYGWGFNPHEIIKIGNPDTGEVYNERLNNHGWRDRDRTYINLKKSYRILIIGDSNTYGAIVPMESIYTQILESRLNSENYNVEVINIAYGRWGTDQQLEALRIEGLRYSPDLIILQFCTNDLNENLYYRYAPDLKPFFYDFDSNNKLVRYKNELWFQKKLNGKDKIRVIIDKSEILKRIYGLCIHYRRKIPSKNKKYNVTQKKINQMKLAVKKINPIFLDWLQKQINTNIKEKDLMNSINFYREKSFSDTIMRIFEKRWFNDYWEEDSFFPEYPDTKSREWKLYFALLTKAQKLAVEANAEFAVFSDNEIGHYEWGIYWYRISSDEVSMANYLAPSNIIQHFCEDNGIGFIKNTHKHTRARNDPHPNIDGNYAMALNIYEYLMAYHKSDILSY